MLIRIHQFRAMQMLNFSRLQTFRKIKSLRLKKIKCEKIN